MKKIQSRLTLDNLNSLLLGKDLAIHITNYIDSFTCDYICSRILKEDTNQWLQNYSMANDINLKRIGMTLFETESKTDMLKRYFNEAKETEKFLDHVCIPFSNPLKSVMQKVGDLWPHGNYLQTHKGQALNFGLCRVLYSGQEFQSHQDFLIRDVDWNELVNNYIDQLAINLYLHPSESGGELEIWDYSPKHDELEKYANGTHDFYHRSLLPNNSTTISPQKGDLIIFRSTCVHAVRAGVGKRISLANFIAFYGQDRSLKYWI